MCLRFSKHRAECPMQALAQGLGCGLSDPSSTLCLHQPVSWSTLSLPCSSYHPEPPLCQTKLAGTGTEHPQLLLAPLGRHCCLLWPSSSSIGAKVPYSTCWCLGLGSQCQEVKQRFTLIIQYCIRLSSYMREHKQEEKELP